MLPNPILLRTHHILLALPQIPKPAHNRTSLPINLIIKDSININNQLNHNSLLMISTFLYDILDNSINLIYFECELLFAMILLGWLVVGWTHWIYEMIII